MKSLQITLKKRFAIIVYSILLLVFVLFLTSLNQFNKLIKYNSLRDNASVLVESKYTLDSLQNVMLSLLPRDIVFYKNNRSRIVEDIKANNDNLRIIADQVASSFYLSSNKKIKTKVFQINTEYRRYGQILDNYTSLLKEKGFNKYGLNGQIDLLSENILMVCAQSGLANVAQKVKNIENFKNEYLLIREPALINKIVIENNEARAYVLLADKGERLALLNKLQRLDDNIQKLNQFDVTIGLTPNDGVVGNLKRSKDQIALYSNELKILVSEEVESAIVWAYIWLSLLFVILVAAFYFMYRSLNKFVHRPLRVVSRFLVEMVKGKLPEAIEFRHKDEIAEISNHLNTIVSGLQSKAEFAIEIGEGKLDSHYQPLSEDDILGNALIEMEKSLQKADLEDRKYKNDEKKRIWANEGLARFAEILRMHNNDINKLADEIIQNLVKYLNASQGGLYFVNDDDKTNTYLELVSAYAFDRKKFIKSTVLPGEGLIGAAALEKEKIFLTDIPEEYLSINSGLGDAPPRSILIIPLKLEDVLLGVVELAAFTIFAEHEIEFVEKIGETIASTITSVKINARTSKLLEQSQKQAEEMAEQEEEMRQNMEELRTTQEDFARREAEIQGLVNAIRISTMVMILDSTGKVIEANDKLLNVLIAKEEDIIGRNHKELLSQGRTSEEYDKFWEGLSSGKSLSSIEKVRLSTGKDVYLKQSFTPILDKKGELNKVLCVSTDITESKTNEQLLTAKTGDYEKIKSRFEQLNAALDSTLVRCEYSPEGRILDVNDNYCRLTGHARNELVGKVNTIYLKEDEKAQFDKIWNEVIKNKPYTGSLKRTKPTGEDIWLMASFIPNVNEDKTVLKIYLVAQDITERRLKYQLLEEANKEIDRLRKEKNLE